MKANKFFAAAMAALTLVGFAACNGRNGSEYKLDKTQVSVAVDETVQLSVVPSATAEWSSNKTDIATVDATGLVKGIAVGNAIITAKIGEQELSAMVTVTAGGGGENPVIDDNLPASLKGTNYILFQLDDITRAKLEGRILADLYIDDQENGVNLWVWDETYNAGETTGMNFYGEAEGWPAFQVTNVGWSGLGQNVGTLRLAELNKMAAVMEDPSAYYFHIAMKSTDNASHCLELDGTTGKGQVTIGATEFVDNGNKIAIAGDFTRDGSWHEIEIPMTTFTSQGLQYGSNNTTGINALVFLSGPTAGTMLQYDACFIYKK